MALQYFGKFVQGAVIQRKGQRTPLIQGFNGPGSGVVRPDMLELLFF
jgi:hypothetical protein